MGEQCDKLSNLELVRMMKDMVPEYVSKNSVYEVLDHQTKS